MKKKKAERKPNKRDRDQAPQLEKPLIKEKLTWRGRHGGAGAQSGKKEKAGFSKGEGRPPDGLGIRITTGKKGIPPRQGAKTLGKTGQTQKKTRKKKKKRKGKSKQKRRRCSRKPVISKRRKKSKG